jgi:hypothetical protein
MERYELLTWRITDEKLEQWKCLDPNYPRDKAHDCTINVLSFFDLLDRDNAETIAEYKNIEATNPNAFKKGTLPIEVTEHLYQVLTTDIKRDYKFFSFPFNAGYADFLKQQIPPGHGTLILLRSDQPVGHDIIVAVDEKGLLVFIDPQQYNIYYTPEMIEQALKGYTHFNLLFSSLKKAHMLSETKFNVRKNKDDVHPTKRQRTSYGGKRGKKNKKNKRTKRTRK